MCVEHRLGETARFEQRKAQQNRVAHAAPHGGTQIAADGNGLHQYRIDRHADDNEKCLEAEGKQGSKIVLPHAARLLAHHGRHWNRGDRRDKVDLNHAPVGDEEHADGDGLHGDAHKQALEPQAEQFSDLHALQPCFEAACHGENDDAGVAAKAENIPVKSGNSTTGYAAIWVE